MKKSKIRNFLMHYMNPQHVMCRLRECGIPCGYAKGICFLYEKKFYNVLFYKIFY